MARRNLLHISKLEEFKEWCHRNKIPTRPPKGEYQILQVKNGLSGWGIVYKRLNAKEHYTVDKNIEKYVTRFIQEQKACK